MIFDLTISLPVHAGTIVNPQPSIVNGVAFLYNCCFGRRTRLSEKMRLLGQANNKIWRNSGNCRSCRSFCIF